MTSSTAIIRNPRTKFSKILIHAKTLTPYFLRSIFRSAKQTTLQNSFTQKASQIFIILAKLRPNVSPEARTISAASSVATTAPEKSRSGGEPRPRCVRFDRPENRTPDFSYRQQCLNDSRKMKKVRAVH